MVGRKVIIIVSGMIAVLAAVHWLELHRFLLPAMQWIEGLGAWAPLFLVASYVAACLLLFPVTILTFGAGALFGPLTGAVAALAGLAAGSALAFLVGRYLARNWVERFFHGDDRFTRIDEAVSREGWKIVALTRLPPLFPFVPLNYAYGLTRIPLRGYVFATCLGVLPKTLMYVYFGSLVGELAEIEAGIATMSPAEWVYGILIFIVIIAVMIYVTRIAVAGLKRETGSALEQERLLRF